MSNLYGQKSYNNYHYNQKREEPHKVLGTTFNPYQPKISNQVIKNNTINHYHQHYLKEKPQKKSSII